MKTRKELEAFTRETIKGIKTEKDLSDFGQMHTKVTVEAALNANTIAQIEGPFVTMLS